MTLKNLLKMINNRMKLQKNQERKKQVDEQCYNRSRKDMEIIDNYLFDTIVSLVSHDNNKNFEEGKFYIGKSTYIRFWAFASGGKLTSPKDKSDNPIFLDNETKLIIGQSDLARFCKKHKLKLAYYHHKYVSNSYISRDYDYNIVDDFLIKIS